MERMSYRGYSWRNDELAVFRAFKADGAIAKQARPERYAVDFDSRLNARLWRMTRVRPGVPPNVYEQQIASMPKRHSLYIHA